MPSTYDFSKRFRSISDASMRHRGTYIGVRQADGSVNAMLINDIGGNTSNPTLHISDPLGRNSREIRMGHESVVLERPELGMANVLCNRTRKNVAVWYESMARRQVKRSLDFGLTSKTILWGDVLDYIDCSTSLSNSSTRLKVLDCFYNQRYPRYTECLESIGSGRCISMAFSQRFALGNHSTYGIVLYYKSKIVGYVTEALPTLLPQFEYLAESLEESSHGYE